jgi:hypothetical protein
MDAGTADILPICSVFSAFEDGGGKVFWGDRGRTGEIYKFVPFWKRFEIASFGGRWSYTHNDICHINNFNSD